MFDRRCGTCMHYEPERGSKGRPLTSKPGACTYDLGGLRPHLPICTLDGYGHLPMICRSPVWPHTNAKRCPCWVESDAARKERRRQERKEMKESTEFTMPGMGRPT